MTEEHCDTCHNGPMWPFQHPEAMRFLFTLEDMDVYVTKGDVTSPWLRIQGQHAHDVTTIDGVKRRSEMMVSEAAFYKTLYAALMIAGCSNDRAKFLDAEA